MLTLLRLLLWGWSVQLFFLLAFPEWTGVIYHVVCFSALSGAAVGLTMFMSILGTRSLTGRLLFDLAFVLGLVLFFGYTMPQKSGTPPIPQVMAGKRPNRSDARDGVQRLGVDPNSPAARFVISLFPKR